MAQWQRTLDIARAWKAHDADELTIQELAGIIAAGLRKMVPFPQVLVDEARREIADTFESLEQEEDVDVDDFDATMADLYDWGDQSLDGQWNGKKVCWVKTF
jgi:hypothetical protein